MVPGDSIEFAGYQMTYDAPFLRRFPNRQEEGARIEVVRNGRVEVMEPRINLFDNAGTAIGTPAVLSRPSGDLYLTLRSIGPEQIVLTIDHSPLQWLLWLGGLVAAGGGVLSLGGRRQTTTRRSESVGV